MRKGSLVNERKLLEQSKYDESLNQVRKANKLLHCRDISQTIETTLNMGGLFILEPKKF